jgi:hypothetical protein
MKFGRKVAFLGVLAALGALYRACDRWAPARAHSVHVRTAAATICTPTPARAAHLSLCRSKRFCGGRSAPCPPSRPPRNLLNLRARSHHSQRVRISPFAPLSPYVDHERATHSAAVQLHRLREPVRRQLSAAVDALLSVAPTLVGDASASVRPCFARQPRARALLAVRSRCLRVAPTRPPPARAHPPSSGHAASARARLRPRSCSPHTHPTPGAPAPPARSTVTRTSSPRRCCISVLAARATTARTALRAAKTTPLSRPTAPSRPT